MTMLLEIERFIYADEGTIGKFLLNRNFLCYSLERPWVLHPKGRAGVPFQSCIREGIYELEFYDSPHRGMVLLLSAPLMGVYKYKEQLGLPSDRWMIQIHPANYIDELAGCIAPGTSWNYTGGLTVGNSQVAFNKLMTVVQDNQIDRVIIRTYRPVGV